MDNNKILPLLLLHKALKSLSSAGLLITSGMSWFACTSSSLETSNLDSDSRGLWNTM